MNKISILHWWNPFNREQKFYIALTQNVSKRKIAFNRKNAKNRAFQNVFLIILLHGNVMTVELLCDWLNDFNSKLGLKNITINN